MNTFNYRTDPSLVEFWDWTTAVAINPDGSGGVPANGATAAYWAGGKGVANATTASTYGTLLPPTVKTSGYNNVRALTFSGSVGLSAGQPATLTGIISSSTAYFSVVVAAMANSNTTGYIISRSTNGAYGYRWQYFTIGDNYGTPPTVRAGRSGGDAAVAITMNTLFTGGLSVDFSTGGRSMSKTYVNGRGTYGLNGLGTDAAEDLSIGGQVYNNAGNHYLVRGFHGDIYGVWFYDRQLTPLEHKMATDQIYADLAQTAPDGSGSCCVLMDVNSILSFNDTSHAMPALVPAAGIYNVGWGGKTGAQQLKWHQQDILPLVDYLRHKGAARIVYYLNEGTNDITGGVSPNQAAQNLANVCQQVRPWVDRIIVGTLLDRTTISRELQVQFTAPLLNDFIPAGLADAIDDWSQISFGQMDGAQSKWLCVDGIHPVEPYGMGLLRNLVRDAIAAQVPAPSSPTGNWRVNMPPQNAIPSGRTTGNFILYPETGNASGVTVTITSSSTSDVIVSDDASFVGSGNSGTLTWGTSGASSWIGRNFAVRWGTDTAARTITVSIGGTTVLTIAGTFIFTNNGTAAKLTLVDLRTTVRRSGGAPSPLFALYLGDSGGNPAPMPSGSSGTVTITPSAGTVTVVSGSLTFDRSSAEVFFTVTPPAGQNSFTLTITNSISTATIANPSVNTYTFGSTTQSAAITAPGAATNNGPNRMVNGVASYWGAYALAGVGTSTITGTPSDSLGRTFSPATITVKPTDLVRPFRLAAGSPAGTHSVTVANSSGFPAPTASNWTDTAAPYASPLTFTNMSESSGSVSVTVATTAPTGGTSPYTYQFAYAPDSSGSPGTWTNIGTPSSATSATVTGLSTGTVYWFKCTVTDSASLSGVSAFYALATTDLVPGTCSTSSVTQSSFQAATTAATGGVWQGSVSYQLQVAPDVSGAPGTFANVGAAGTPQSDTGLTAGTKYWARFYAKDSNPVVNSLAYTSAVSVTTQSSATGHAAFSIVVAAIN